MQRRTPDAQSDGGPRRSRLSGVSAPRVAQVVPPVLKPANAAPPPRRAAPVPRLPRAGAAAPRINTRREGQSAARGEAQRRASVDSLAAATSSAAESEGQSSLVDIEADVSGGVQPTSHPVCRLQKIWASTSRIKA